MGIGVKETQDIIRRAVAVSRNEPAAPARLDPNEAGMATGPRHRKRALMRPGRAPEYLRSGGPDSDPGDPWQRLDDDIYKFLQLRRDQFGRLSAPPSQQFIAEMEAQLRFADPEYELGTYLGLLRMAADLDQTRLTCVTASEMGAFRAFARRLTDGRKEGESFDPDSVKRYLDLIDENDPATWRGLADFFRLVARAARLPLLSGMREAPALSLAVMLQVVDLATRFNRGEGGRQEFQVGPVDVFLGARSVLFNRSVTQPTLSLVKELVLDETGLYHEDLLEWLRSVGVFGSELTLQMPVSLAEDGFALQGARYGAVEMVVAAGERLARTPALAARALGTLSDAILFKIQQQDSHKDRQVQGILGHFNRLLHGERRSAARVSEERQQARFDYVSAIQRAGDLVKEIQTGQFRAVTPEGMERPLKPGSHVEALSLAAPEDRAPEGVAGNVSAAAAPATGPVAPPLPSLRSFPPASVASAPAAVLAGLPPRDYEKVLGEWDALIGRIRRKLSAKSPVFKTLVALLAKARAADTCLVHGITPAGGRLASRLARLLQGEEARERLGLDEGIAEALEDAFSLSYPRFLSSVESLLLAVYDFREGLEGIQFRLRDRGISRRPDGVASAAPDLEAHAASAAEEAVRDVRSDRGVDPRETVAWSDGADLDETLLKLLLGSILLGRDAEGGVSAREDAPAPESRFRSDGRLRPPKAGEFAFLGAGDPLLAYGSLLWVGRETLGPSLMGDPEANLTAMVRLSPEARASLFRRYRELASRDASGDGPRHPVSVIRRAGWETGFEMGFMGEIRHAYENSQVGSGLEGMLRAHLASIQPEIDQACGKLEREKIRQSRERLLRCLG